MPLEFVKKGAGRADSRCGRYQISIATVRGSEYFTAFYVTGNTTEPFKNLCGGWSKSEIKKACQLHADKMAGR